MKVGFARGFGIDAHRATLQGFSLAHEVFCSGGL
jgi:hypothetical protein